MSFKGDKRTKRAKRKQTKSKHDIQKGNEEKKLVEAPFVDNPYKDDDLTEAEKKALEKKLARQRADLEKLAAKSHRERIEEFNEKLGKLTEHNDIPRVRFPLGYSRLLLLKSSFLTVVCWPVACTGECRWKWINMVADGRCNDVETTDR